MEDCIHPSIEGGICVLCGVCMSFDQDYVPMYAARTLTTPGKMRYTAVDHAKRYDKQVDSLLDMLGVSNYSSEVKSLLATKRFKHRTSMSDKVLVTTYYVLKRHQYPISYSDILPYTEKSNVEFKRIFLREFQHAGASQEYLTNVFNRVKEFYSSHGLKKEACLKDFICVADRYKCVNPQILCKVYFIRDEDVLNCYEKFKLDRFMSIEVLRNTMKKVMEEQIPLAPKELDAPRGLKLQKRQIEKDIKKYFMDRMWREES